MPSASPNPARGQQAGTFQNRRQRTLAEPRTRLERVEHVATDVDLYPLPDGRLFFDEQAQHWTGWVIASANGYGTLERFSGDLVGLYWGRDGRVFRDAGLQDWAGLVTAEIVDDDEDDDDVD